MAGKIKIVSVHIWGKELGRLFWDERHGNSTFAFSKDLVYSGWDVSPILFPEGGPERLRAVNGYKEKPFRGLPPFLADSLPDDWGHLLFSASQEGRIFSNPLERLSYIGRRGMGAFEFLPEAPDGIADQQVDIAEMRDLAERIYRDREKAIIAKGEELTMERLRRIGSPPGGRQPKAVIAIDGEGNVRSGQVTGGFRYYILKFQPGDHPAASLIEMTYYELALRCGITMSSSRPYPIDDTVGFLTERFDRKPGTGERIHMQTLAALYPDSVSYEDLFRVARRIGIPGNEIRELYVRTVFNFLACNTDDHFKNFSFMMEKDGGWHLTPAYDITYTVDPMKKAFRQEHCLSLNGKFVGVTVRDLVSFGKDNDIRDPESVVTKVAEGLTHLRETAVHYGVPMAWIDRMEENVSEGLPEEFASRMHGFAGEPMDDYRTRSGLSVTDVRFEETMNGNIHLFAVIDGQEYKYVFAKKSPMWDEIVSKGANRMMPSEKKALVDSFLVPKAERDRGLFLSVDHITRAKGICNTK